nr:hypothetical protein [Neisseria uirgultaei]
MKNQFARFRNSSQPAGIWQNGQIVRAFVDNLLKVKGGGIVGKNVIDDFVCIGNRGLCPFKE